MLLSMFTTRWRCRERSDSSRRRDYRVLLEVSKRHGGRGGKGNINGMDAGLWSNRIWRSNYKVTFVGGKLDVTDAIASVAVHSGTFIANGRT
ncbi:hypothetical protein Trydic_g6773, partial [Trypoxylus dichotomus]